MDDFDLGWSIVCPDNKLRREPYINEDDAEFDNMYFSTRGCFYYKNRGMRDFDNKCPQGDHLVTCSIFDKDSGQLGSTISICDYKSCRKQSCWRTAINIYSDDNSLEVHSDIAIKLCDTHKNTAKPIDFISKEEWALIRKQFMIRDIELPEELSCDLVFRRLVKKKKRKRKK